MNDKIRAVIRDRDDQIQDIYEFNLRYRSRRLDNIFDTLKGFKGGRLEITFLEEQQKCF